VLLFFEPETDDAIGSPVETLEVAVLLFFEAETENAIGSPVARLEVTAQLLHRTLLVIVALIV